MQVLQVKIRTSSYSTNYTAMSFSPDGRYIAVRAEEFTLLDTRSESTRILAELVGVYRGFGFIGAGLLAYLQSDGRVQIVDLATNKKRQRAIAPQHPHSFAAVPGADLFFVSVRRRWKDTHSIVWNYGSGAAE